MEKFIASYYVNWKGFNYSIAKLPVECNQVYLFHAKPNGDGSVYFESPGDGFYKDCQLALSQGRRLILSVGGANFGFELPDRNHSDKFVESVKNIFKVVCGSIDTKSVKLGLDWNNFEAHVKPSTGEMVYVSRTLKSVYGNDFVITSPVAPWRQEDKEWAKLMNDSNCLDYVSPQYYDGPGLNTTDYVITNIESWVSLLGETRVGLGLGILSPTNTGHYWTMDQASECIKKVFDKYPNLRGVFSWELIGDIVNNNDFISIASSVIKAKKSYPNFEDTFVKQEDGKLKLFTKMNGIAIKADITLSNIVKI